ncbi:MAG TPA: hypothetical protein VEZ14_01300 [Dehalococcoidia bacterium]|nr:hypothetical protein [Dehalococcoidia bacterium]
MPEFLLIVESAARRFFEEIATRDEQVRLSRIMQEILTDPQIDRRTKFPFPVTDGAMYADGEFWIVYSTIEPGTVSILNIGFEEEPPSVGDA